MMLLFRKRCWQVALATTKPANRQAGFGIGSMLAGLALSLLVYQGFSSILAYHRATPTVNQTATHLEQISQAAANYIQDNYAELTTTLPLNGAAATIPTQTLKDQGYLSQSLTDQNPYGQAASVRLRYTTQGTGANTRNVLEPLVVTEGGRPIEDHELLRIAGKLKGGGGIRSTDPSLAIGNNGSWQVPMNNFGGSPGAGHLAVGMFYSDAGMIADYLYRNAVPGRPEVNRMNTDIDMAGNAINDADTVQTGEAHLTRIVVEATACAPEGAIARDATGNPMSCQNAVWTQTASLEWVPGQGQRMRFTAANGQSMWMQNENGRFRWVNGAWTTELASIDQAGNLTARGRVRAGEYVQLDGIAVEGTGCSPNGLVGRTAIGLVVSCQAAVWRKASGSSAWNMFEGASCGGVPSGQMMCAYDPFLSPYAYGGSNLLGYCQGGKFVAWPGLTC